jgi:hypothetical protein
MSTSNESPVISFLTRDENLPPALEIISRGSEIRNYAKRRFWNKLESEIKKYEPQDLNLRLDSEETPSGSEIFFDLYARLSPIDKKTQGLQYAIEICSEYCGIGLRWINDRSDFKDLSSLPLVITLHSELHKTRQGDIDSESNRWWLWFEYWEKNPYDDPWIWFVKKSDDASFFAGKAKKFWEFVQPTYAQVLKINQDVNRSNK